MKIKFSEFDNIPKLPGASVEETKRAALHAKFMLDKMTDEGLSAISIVATDTGLQIATNLDDQKLTVAILQIAAEQIASATKINTN